MLSFEIMVILDLDFPFKQFYLHPCENNRGGSRISFGGGGGGAQKIICANAHYEREIRSSFRQGSRAKGPGSSRGFLMLSIAI